MKFAFKLIVSVSVIVWIVYGMDLDSLRTVLTRVDVTTLVLATAVIALLNILISWRWGFVLRRLGADFKPLERVANVFVGQFFNQTLPSTIGGDAVRIWMLRRAGMSLRPAANSVLIDRVMGLGTLILFALAGLPWLGELDPSNNAPIAVSVIAVIGLLGLTSLALLDKLPEAITRMRLVAAVTTFSLDMRTSVFHATTGLVILGCSVTVHAILAAAVWMIAVRVGVDISLGACIILVPLVMVVSALPISVAGWGLREGAMVAAFGLVGVPDEQSFAVSLLFGLCMILAGLPGGALWLRRRRQLHLGEPSEPRQAPT